MSISRQRLAVLKMATQLSSNFRVDSTEGCHDSFDRLFSGQSTRVASPSFLSAVDCLAKAGFGDASDELRLRPVSDRYENSSEGFMGN
jgi:hypothetical protein